MARHNIRDEKPWCRIEDLRDCEFPRPLVLVNGAFDILHSGHMKVIHAARKSAPRGTVIVAVDSDIRVRGAKGTGRPIQTWVERATTMNFMPVDIVVEIETDRDMARLIRAVRPDLRVQGYDYQHKPSKFDVPKVFVRGTGMRTSKIIERCKKSGN